MADLKLKFKMPDDETLAEYISIKGEKGERGDPTKTSQLENDSDFTTNAALNSGLATKADKTTVQSLTNQVNTNTSALANLSRKNIFLDKRNAGSGGWWYKIATLGAVSDARNSGSIRLHGKISGVASYKQALVDIVLMNRNNGLIARGELFCSDDFTNADFVMYQDDDTGEMTLYLKFIGWNTTDLDVFCADCTYDYDGTYVSAEPSGTLVWSLTEDDNIQKNINGTVDVDITGDAATVNGHTVEINVPSNAVFTDTVYDDTAMQAQIDSKANTTDVASTYATKAEVQSITNGSPLSADSVSEMTDTTRIYVLTTNGHWYYYDGSAWTDGGVYQAVELADNSVSPRKTTFYKRTTNLFDKDECILIRGMFNTTTSKIVTVDNQDIFVVALPCETSTTYVLRKTKGWRLQIANTSEMPANGVSYTNYTNANNWSNQDVEKVYTTSANAAYIVIYIYNQGDVNNPELSDILDTLMISEGSTQNYYEPYAYLDIDGAVEEGSIGSDKLATQGLMLYEGKIYVDFYTNKITLSDDLNDFASANNDKRLTVSGSVAREFTISDTRLMALTATISGSSITSIQLELYSQRDVSHPVIMYVCSGNKTYSAPYEYNKSIITEARYAKLFNGEIIVDKGSSVIKFSGLGFIVGDGFEQVNVDVSNLPTEIAIPNDYATYALTLSVSGSTAISIQLEHWGRISPQNHIICWLRGTLANKSLFAPFDYRGRIRYMDNQADYENDVTLAMFNRIAAIGDSYTNGTLYYGGSGDAYAHTSPDKKLSYIGVMGRRNGTDWDNYGIGGITTRAYLTNPNGLPAVLTGEEADLYFLALGINDAGKLGADYLGTVADITNDYTQNPDTFYGNYARIIEQVQAHAPHAKFIMVGIMRPDSWNANYASFRAAIQEIAEHYGFPYINPYDDRFFTSSVMSHLSGNHPTAAGYTGIALALERLFAKTVDENPTYYIDADYGSVVGD